MSDLFSDASRRGFLQTGLAVTVLGSAGAARGQSPGTGTTIPTPPVAPPMNATNPMEVMGPVSAGDIAILRFSIANELIGGDIWGQYGNQVLYNPAFRTALAAIDPMLPRYVLYTVRYELSHGAFLTALANVLGVPPVNLDAFRTLPDPGAAAATGAGQAVTEPELANIMSGSQAAGLSLPPPGTPRLVNLTQLNLDTSWFNKYRTASNPDFHPDPPQLATLMNVSTIPQQGGSGGSGMTSQGMANAALLHMSGNEQLESSAYVALGALLRNREMLRLMGSLTPVEMMHYTAFQTSVARMQGGSTGTGSGTGTGADTGMIPDLRAQASQIPLPILPAPATVYAGLPPVSVVRPTTLPRAGAVVTAQKLAAMNHFAGQPAAFLTMVMQIAQAADAAGTVAVLGPRDLQTTQSEITLSSLGSMSGNGPLTYSVRLVQGSASVLGGDTPNPRVQFLGGSGYRTFELTVTDAMGNTATDTVTVLYTGQ